MQDQTSQHGNNIGTIANIACATNANGDLHVLVIDGTTLQLWHTMHLISDPWPYPFRSVQDQISQHDPKTSRLWA